MFSWPVFNCCLCTQCSFTLQLLKTWGPQWRCFHLFVHSRFPKFPRHPDAYSSTVADFTLFTLHDISVLNELAIECICSEESYTRRTILIALYILTKMSSCIGFKPQVFIDVFVPLLPNWSVHTWAGIKDATNQLFSERHWLMINWTLRMEQPHLSHMSSNTF